VRVRPPLRATDPGYELIPQRFQKGMVHVTSPTSIAVDSPQGRKIFVFDRVFGPEVNQDGVWEYLEESVNAFLQGYNVSVLAYGQSGAGKSYTMGTAGPGDQAESKVMGECRYDFPDDIGDCLLRPECADRYAKVVGSSCEARIEADTTFS
jgi:hypothetical protein